MKKQLQGILIFISIAITVLVVINFLFIVDGYLKRRNRNFLPVVDVYEITNF